MARPSQALKAAREILKTVIKSTSNSARTLKFELYNLIFHLKALMLHLAYCQNFDLRKTIEWFKWDKIWTFSTQPKDKNCLILEVFLGWRIYLHPHMRGQGSTQKLFKARQTSREQIFTWVSHTVSPTRVISHLQCERRTLREIKVRVAGRHNQKVHWS